MKKNALPRKCLRFEGTQNISDELDRLLELYAAKHRINVKVTLADEQKFKGRLEKASHPQRIILKDEHGKTTLVMYLQIKELIHDLMPEKTTSLSPNGARS